MLDATTGALIADVPLPRACTLAAFDAETDRLYLLSPDGHLLVMRGHGAAAPAPTAIEPTGVVTGSVAWIAPSPDFVRDPPAGVLFAAWTEEGTISGGPAGALAGRLFASADGGATWSRVSGGLPPHLLVNALAFSPDFVRDRRRVRVAPFARVGAAAACTFPTTRAARGDRRRKGWAIGSWPKSPSRRAFRSTAPCSR